MLYLYRFFITKKHSFTPWHAHFVRKNLDRKKDLPIGMIHATRIHAILYMRLQSPAPENQPVWEIWFLGHLLRISFGNGLKA